MEGATRNIFDGFTKALNWPLAPQPAERPGAAPKRTAVIFLQPRDPLQKLFLQPRKPCREERIARTGALAQKFGDGQLCKFSRFGQVLA